MRAFKRELCIQIDTESIAVKFIVAAFGRLGWAAQERKWFLYHTSRRGVRVFLRYSAA